MNVQERVKMHIPKIREWEDSDEVMTGRFCESEHSIRRIIVYYDGGGSH